MAKTTFTLEAHEAQAVNAFLKVVDAANKTKEAVRGIARESDSFGAATVKWAQAQISPLVSWAAGLFSVQTAISAIRTAWSAMEEEFNKSVESMKKFQEQFIDLQFVGENFKKSGGLRAQVMGLAEQYAMDPGEVAKGWAALQKATPQLTGSQRWQALEAMIKLRKTGSEDLSSYAQGVGLMSSNYQTLKSNEISNIMDMMGDKGVSVSGETIGAGRIGKLDARTAAALAVAYRTQTGGTGGLDTMTRILMTGGLGEEDSGLPEFQKIQKAKAKEALFQRAGIDETDDVVSRLKKLSAINAVKELTSEETAAAFGGRNMKAGLAMLAAIPQLDKQIEEFRGGTGAEVDIVGREYQTALKTDETFRLSEQSKRIAAQTGSARQRPGNLAWDAAAARIKQLRAEGKLGWFDAWYSEKTMGAFRNDSAEDAAKYLARYYEANEAENLDEAGMLNLARRDVGLSPLPQAPSVSQQIAEANQKWEETKDLIARQFTRPPNPQVHRAEGPP